MNSSTEPTPTSTTTRPGRPRALDDAKRREIVAVITAGFTIERAARYVDCAPSTIRRETIRNQEFNRQLRRALLTAEMAPLNAIREAARKYWRAGAWLLERMDPQRFAKPDVKTIKPEEVNAISELLGEFLRDEVADPEERMRVVEKFDALARAIERNAIINANTPPPRRSTPKRRRHNRYQEHPRRSDLAQKLLTDANLADDHPACAPATETPLP